MNEIKDYITRSVTDIARKCGCKQDEVIAELRYFIDSTHLKCKITEATLRVINEKRIFFEFDKLPDVGEEWEIVDIKTYPNVNSGQPVVEIKHKDGRWMRVDMKCVELL